MEDEIVLRTKRLDEVRFRALIQETCQVEFSSRPKPVEVIKRAAESKGLQVGEMDDLASTAKKFIEYLGESFDINTDVEGRNLSEVGRRKIVHGLTLEPWTFLCEYSKNDASSVHNDIYGVSYGFNSNVTTWRGIVASGAGSRLLFYHTGKADRFPMAFGSTATVKEIIEIDGTERSGVRQWRAVLDNFHELSPVGRHSVHIEGWNSQHGIAEIEFQTFTHILSLGGLTQEVFESENRDIEVDGDDDEQSIELFITQHISGDRLDLSDAVPAALSVNTRQYENSAERQKRYQQSSNRSLDKATEAAGVSIAQKFLHQQGFSLVADRQKDGVGYDFDYRLGEQIFHVEIKGIRGDKPEFNMTAKEWWRAETDPQFFLLAVTQCLDAEKAYVHKFSNKELGMMKVEIAQLRVSSPDLQCP